MSVWAGSLLYCGFLELFCWAQLPAASVVAAGQINSELKLAIKLREEISIIAALTKIHSDVLVHLNMLKILWTVAVACTQIPKQSTPHVFLAAHTLTLTLTHTHRTDGQTETKTPVSGGAEICCGLPIDDRSPVHPLWLSLSHWISEMPLQQWVGGSMYCLVLFLNVTSPVWVAYFFSFVQFKVSWKRFSLTGFVSAALSLSPTCIIRLW